MKRYDCPGACSLADHIALHEARLTTETAVKIVMTTWFVVAAVNMWIGVARAGYSFTEEPPIFLLTFLLPAVAAIDQVEVLLNRVRRVMGTGRLEAFSDGVLAIIITIMVLEMKVPHGETLEALLPLLPVFLSYVLSFIYLGIYWNNHHHMLHACQQVSGTMLWANLHLLFWLSLIPFVTGWMGENSFAAAPTALYGVVLLMAAIAYWLLQRTIMGAQGPDSLLHTAVGRDLKGKISPVLYVIAIPAAFLSPWLAGGIYVLGALIWLVPDRRIEHALRNQKT